MDRVYIKGKITIDDVNKYNEMLPKIIEISNTKGQDIEVLSKLDSRISIRIVGGLDEKRYPKFSKQSYHNKTLYTPGQVCEIIKSFQDIEKEINPGWSDLEASLYTYIELIKRVEHIDEDDSQNEKDIHKTLSGITSRKATPTGFATIYKEAMDRLGIPCKYIDKQDGSHAWNEIKINGEYYPLDLDWDSIYYRSKESEGKMGICNFLTDKEFYFNPNHQSDQLSDEELKKVRALEESEVNKALEIINSKTNSNIVIERPTISVKSKELAGIFKNNEITTEEISDVKEIKISVKDSEFKELKSDLAQIGRYYPEVLRNVVLENTTASNINMQEVVNEVYDIRSNFNKTNENQFPISITISSSFEEDFDLDFSNAPAVASNANNFVDGVEKQKIILKNLAGNTIKLPSLKGKISKNINELSVDGFDLANLDISDSNLQKMSISSELTRNIELIEGFEQLSDVAFEALDKTAFDNALSTITSSTSDIHDLTIKNQDFHDRKILEELAVNPNLVRLKIVNSKLNDLDGLENFDNRLGLLALWDNDLEISHLDRLNTFWNNNQYLRLYLNNNQNIIDAIQRAPEISDESHNLMSDIMYLSGIFNSREDKVYTLNRLLWTQPDIPYYIKDAQIIRENLRITRNPMMLENDSEIDTTDFNQSYLQNGTLLLTVPQVERLLASGKVIPQNVRINIHDVSELSSQKAKKLLQQMNNKGMNLTGVQIFDENIDNKYTQIAPYTMSQYVYIRDTLDLVVNDIDPAESDLDKFATIYQIFMDSIVYDHDAMSTNTDTKDSSIYVAKKFNSSRNLLEGLEEGKCVCAGYADILRNALALVGIESRINSGSCTGGGHAWNQVRLDDGTGNKKWYYTDLTFDAGIYQNRSNEKSFILLGKDNFIKRDHGITHTKDIEDIEPDDYDRVALREAFARARARSFDFRQVVTPITIPEDPQMTVEILDQNRITAEYQRRKQDMYAKFYGDKDYQNEYDERNRRYREHEIEVTENGITYRTVEDYQEKEDDEKFLFLDKYKDCLERLTRYQAGDTSVYQGTDAQIRDAFEKDREYVETRNHTFNQHANTQKDLATLGKYGERVPYIPRQQGVLRNIVRAVGNVGIFTRNAVSPVYRVVGKYVAQPLHRLVTRGKDASPYRNNFYHRMVARRDYFTDTNNTQNPGHPIRNAIKSRVDALLKVKEGNEAVLRAGAADIRENVINQERENVVIQSLTARTSNFDMQIQQLQQEIASRPNASNISDVRQALQNKITERDRINSQIEDLKNRSEGMSQTDAISDKQHSIASKEVNTMRTTVIKGVAKGVAVKYVGPKIHNWLLERGKTTKPIEITTEVPETKQRWVDTTYKNETVQVYEDVIDTGKNMNDIIGANEGKSITGFYSVYGGEKGAATYQLTGDDKITAIFQAEGVGGTGLSDTAGLTAPTLTNGTFASELLDANGVLNQNVTLDQIIEAIDASKIDTEAFSDVYVSVGDKYWTKLSDLLEDVTTKVQVGEEVKKVVDVAGHYENYTEMVEKVIKTTEVVTNPAIEKAVNIGSKIGEGAVMIDGILDVAENLRKTNTDVKSNKKRPRKYDFDEDIGDIPKSKKEYERQHDER